MTPSYQHPPDNRGRHPIDIVPPASSPMTIDPEHPAFGDDVPFWKPSWAESFKFLGWRWIMFAPALLLVGLVISLPWTFQFTGLIFWGGGKLLIISIGIATTAATTALRAAVKQRTHPFCIHCGYELTGLTEDHPCPECGRPFSLRLIDEYRRDPHWFIQRYKHRQTTPMADAPFLAGPIHRQKSRDGT